MIVYVLFVHKKSVSKRKVCIIFIKNKKLKKKQKNIFNGFFKVGFLLPTLPVGEWPDGVVSRRSARVPDCESHAVRSDPLPGVEFVKAGGLVGGGGSGCSVDEALNEGGFAGFKISHHDDSHFMLLLLLLPAHSG
jgi:hypothetical protein